MQVVEAIHGLTRPSLTKPKARSILYKASPKVAKTRSMQEAAVRHRPERRSGRHTHDPRGPVPAASGMMAPRDIPRGGARRPSRGDRIPGRRVPVVDDNRDAADSLAAVLGLLGYRGEVAYGGTGAVQAAIEANPDVAVLDLGMPGMDGYELARR
jgi:PleD family two-component response regulator